MPRKSGKGKGRKGTKSQQQPKVEVQVHVAVCCDGMSHLSLHESDLCNRKGCREKGLSAILLDAAKAGMQPPDFALRGANGVPNSDSDSGEEYEYESPSSVLPQPPLTPESEVDLGPAFEEVLDTETGVVSLVALRDLKPGEMLVQEPPMMTSYRPWARTKDGKNGNSTLWLRHCLACYRNMKNSPYTCSKCKWMVCDKKCEMDPIHAENECSIFAFCTSGMTSIPVRTLLILRLCLFKKRVPEQFDILMKMRSNWKKRQEFPKFFGEDRAVWDFLAVRCGFDFVEREEVLHLSSVLDLHALWLLTTKYCLSVETATMIPQGMYRTFGLLEKGCVPNVAHNLGCPPEYLMTMTVAVPIGKGCKLVGVWGPFARHSDVGLTSYPSRQHELEKAARILCTCQLCSDPSEGGLNMSAIRCPRLVGTGKKAKTCRGWLVPMSPLDFKTTSFKCDECGSVVPFPTHSKMLKEVKEYFDELDTGSPGTVVDFIQRHREELHPNHMFNISALARWVCARFEVLRELPKTKDVGQDLNHFIKYSEHFLKVLDVMRPGTSPERCQFMVQICRAKLLRLVFDWQKNIYSLAEMKVKTQEIQALHKATVEMWQYLCDPNVPDTDGMGTMLKHTGSELIDLVNIVHSSAGRLAHQHQHQRACAEARVCSKHRKCSRD